MKLFDDLSLDGLRKRADELGLDISNDQLIAEINAMRNITDKVGPTTKMVGIHTQLFYEYEKKNDEGKVFQQEEEKGANQKEVSREKDSYIGDVTGMTNEQITAAKNFRRYFLDQAYRTNDQRLVEGNNSEKKA